MPDIAVEDFSIGHGFKTSHMAGFEARLYEVRKSDLRFLFCPFLQAGIQMDIDADDHSEEGIAFSGMYAHIVQMVIIKNSVIYPFAGSAVVVNHLVFLRSSGNRSIEADIPVWLCIDTTAIRRRGTLFPAMAIISFAAGKRAAPFTRMFLFTVTPVDHTVTGHAQRCAVCINRNRAGDGIGSAAVGVEVDKRADAPFFAKSISSIVVMCRIKAEVTDRDIRVNGCKLPQRDDGADTVMPHGTQETDMQGEVNANVCIM